jgi:hypothetical protein
VKYEHDWMADVVAVLFGLLLATGLLFVGSLVFSVWLGTPVLP